MVVNVTVVNGMGVTGSITSLKWAEENLNNGNANGRRESGGDGSDDVLDVKAEFSEVLWPWSG